MLDITTTLWSLSHCDQCSNPDEIIKTLAAAGYVLVPRTPTKDMEYAGLSAAKQGVLHAADHSAEIRMDTAAEVWRAMIERFETRERQCSTTP